MYSLKNGKLNFRVCFYHGLPQISVAFALNIRLESFKQTV